MALYFYYAPKIKNVSVTRHGILGVPSPNGAFLRITATRDFCPFYQTSPGTAEVISNKCEIRYRYRMLPDGAYSAWTTILASSVTHTNEVTTDVMNVGLVSGESYEVIVGVKDDVSEANTSIVLTAGDVFMHRDGEKNSIGVGEAVAEENTVSIAAKMALKVKGLLSVAKEVLVGSGKFSSTSVDMHEEGYFGNFYMSLPQNAEYPATAYLSHPYGGQLIANCGAGRVALTGLTEPVDASDATNKQYVDGNFMKRRRLLTSADDCNNITDDGVYWYSTSSVPANAPFPNAAVMLVFGNDSTTTQKIQFGFRYGMAGHGKFRPLYNNWQPWAEFAGYIEDATYPGCYYRYTNGVQEWVNPPMVDGVEYRTTERLNGKPVYVQRTNIGAIPNAGTVKWEHDLGITRSEIVGWECFIQQTTGYLCYTLPMISSGGNISATCRSSSLYFEVITFSDLSGYQGIVTLRYCKN